MDRENDTTGMGRTASAGGSPADDEPEPTGRPTPVIVIPKRAASAKPRAVPSKGKSAKGDAVSPPRSRRAPASAPAKKPTSTTAKSAAPRSRRAPKRDEASIPPTWSDVDAAGEKIASAEATPILPAPLPSGVTASAGEAAETAAVPVTRPWLSPYVKAAAGLAAAICFVVVGRGLARHAPRPLPASTQMSAAATLVAPPALPPSEDTIAPPADTLNPESAEDDKRASLAALEQRKLAEAIVAGERATELDPTDADAWLILGAAYHDQGNFLAARKCYAECTKQAKRGEVRECTFLLQ
jgi:hypothetical protein